MRLILEAYYLLIFSLFMLLSFFHIALYVKSKVVIEKYSDSYLLRYYETISKDSPPLIECS